MPNPSLVRWCSDTAGSDTRGLPPRARHLLLASKCSQMSHWVELPWSASPALHLFNYIRDWIKFYAGTLGHCSGRERDDDGNK